MLDIINKFNLRIQMVIDECGDLNKLELKCALKRGGAYYKKIDYDFKKLVDLTSVDILELFNLKIKIEICGCDHHKKCSEFVLVDCDDKSVIINYHHQVITIPHSDRINDNTPDDDPVKIIQISYQ